MFEQLEATGHGVSQFTTIRFAYSHRVVKKELARVIASAGQGRSSHLWNKAIAATQIDGMISGVNTTFTFGGVTRSAEALDWIMPWRLLAAPHNGGDRIFSDPIPTFVCPSSELGTQSPDAWNTATPDIRAVFQGALHYRVNGGASTVALVQGTQGRHQWYNKSA